MFAPSLLVAVLAAHAGSQDPVLRPVRQIDVTARIRTKVNGWPRGVPVLVEPVEQESNGRETSWRLRAYARQHISEMESVCSLTEVQYRLLEIAAKGVEHRLRLAAKERDDWEAQNGGDEDLVHVDTAAQLTGHELWARTVERVLTKVQKHAWAAHREATVKRLRQSVRWSRLPP